MARFQVIYRPPSAFGDFRYPPLDLSRPPLNNVARQQVLLDYWQSRFPQAQEDPGVDFEDFHESALHLYHAEHMFGPDAVLIATPHDTDPGALRPLGRVGFRASLPTLLLGNSMRTINDPLRDAIPHLVQPDPEVARMARAYYRLDAFHAHAGRRLALASFHGERNPPHETVILQLYREGVRDFMLKTCAAKYHIERMTLPDGLDDAEVSARIPDAINWASVHMEGHEEGVLVQRHIPMQYEYRFIIIDGKPVCGAGCIEQHTPLDNTSGRFDPRVELNRGDGQTLIDTGRVERARIFAAEVARDIQAEAPELRAYSLDVAWSGDTPVVIELNPCENLGLYAMEMETLLEGYSRLVEPGPSLDVEMVLDM